jgi:hypothetical protein
MQGSPGERRLSRENLQNDESSQTYHIQTYTTFNAHQLPQCLQDQLPELLGSVVVAMPLVLLLLLLCS